METAPEALVPMKQHLKAGADLDILSGEEYQKGNLALIEAINARSKRPSVRTLDQMASLAVANTAILVSKSPPPGRAWEIRRLTLAGPTARTITTLTTGAFVYKTQESPAGFLDVTTTVPNVSVWEAEQLILHPGDTIIIVVVGTAGATDQYAATLQGIDYDTVKNPIGVS